MRTFVRILLGIITVLLWVALLLTDVMSYVQPISALYILCPLTLFFSAFFIFTLFITIYWFFIAKWRMGIIGVILLIVSTPNVLKTYSIVPEYETRSCPDAISVMTYNVHLFDWFSGEKGAENANKTLDYIEASGADIVCMQEFLYYPNGKYTLSYIEEHLPSYPYSHIEVVNDSHRASKCVATFSKHPIVSKESVKLDASCHGAIKSGIVVGGDTITVVNFYLKSNQLTQREKDAIPDTNVQNGDTEQTKGLLRSIYNKLVSASLERCAEANKVAESVQGIEKRLILCGDMNDIPASYAYRTLSEGRNDAFLLMSHLSMGSTFHEGVYNFRIDYIFTSKDLTPVEFSIENQDFSDHYPIILKYDPSSINNNGQHK